MRSIPLALDGLLLWVTVGPSPPAAAQHAPQPTIHRVTVRLDTGIITIMAPASGPTSR